MSRVVCSPTLPRPFSTRIKIPAYLTLIGTYLVGGVFIVAGSLISGCSRATILAQPPLASQQPETVSIGTNTYRDDLRWIEDWLSPQVRALVQRETSYTEALTRGMKARRIELFRELTRRGPKNFHSFPIRVGSSEYRARIEEGYRFAKVVRRDSPDSVEAVVFDPNLFLADSERGEVGALRVSPDNRWIAFSADLFGTGNFQLCVIGMDPGQRPHVLTATNNVYSLEWANDSATVWYSESQDGIPYRLMRASRLFEDQPPTPIIEENDQTSFVHLTRSRTGRNLIVTLERPNSSEIWVGSTDYPDRPFLLLHERVPGIMPQVEDLNSHFLLRTNEQSARYELRELFLNRKRRNSRVLFRSNQEEITDIDTVGDTIFAYLRNGLKSKIAVLRPHRSAPIFIDPRPNAPATLERSVDRDPFERTVRFTLHQPHEPDQLLEYNLETGQTAVIAHDPALANPGDADGLTSELMYAAAPDGTQIPIMVLAHRDTPRPAPVVLYGYGAYGVIPDLTFSAERLSLLQRGVIFAIAHVRGGGPSDWHNQGRLLSKGNSFDDFAASAAALISSRVADPRYLFAYGRSAGALLVSHAVIRQPDLFRAVILDAPFVDVLGSLRNPSSRFIARDLAEWGNPSQQQFFQYLQSYSPYQNVPTAHFPPTLVFAAANDPITPPWEAAKWVAELRRRNSGDQPIALIIREHGDHFGDKLQSSAAWNEALRQAFILNYIPKEKLRDGF